LYVCLAAYLSVPVIIYVPVYEIFARGVYVEFREQTEDTINEHTYIGFIKECELMDAWTTFYE